MFVFYLLLLLLWIIECVRTRFWKDTLTWDFLNIEDLVVATSRGGTAISKVLDSLTKRRGFAVERFDRSESPPSWGNFFSACAADVLKVRLADLDGGKNALLQDVERYEMTILK